MALQVWLPLISDLRQQGIADTSTIALVSGNAFVNGGKIGNKALHLTKQQTILGTSSCMSGKKQMSYAFWVKVNTAWSAQWLDGIAWYSTDGSSAAYSRQEFYTNCTRIGTWFSGGSLSGYVFTPGEWTHIAGTFDYTTGIAKFYINGVLQGTSTSLSKTHYCRGDFYIGDSGVDIVENDVRIYDHCLSPMEVKELAKGLVLHYPLNRQGWGQENLMPGTYKATGNTGNRVYGWQNNGYGTPEIVIKDGSECIHLASNCTGAYTPSIVSASKLLLENGVEYVISCDLMYDKEIKVNTATPIHYHNGSTDNIDEFNMTGVNNGKGFVWKSMKPAANTIIPANTWQHYEQHIKAVSTPGDASLPYSTYRAFIYGSVRTVSETATVNMWLKNWKIEKGSIATPWCPNSSDTLATTMGLNSNIEYDTSGYCNNGIWHGTHTNTSDTPKYAVSTTATGSASTYLEGPILPTEAQTAALWIKCKKSQNAAIFNDKTSGLQIGLLNSILYMNSKTSTAGFTTTHWKDDDWNHVVVTYDGTTRKAYINGEAETQSGTSNYYIHNADNCWLWNRSYNNNCPFNGSLSDLRIYATALSASDVKSLYQNCATIDPDGTIRGQIRS